MERTALFREAKGIVHEKTSAPSNFPSRTHRDRMALSVAQDDEDIRVALVPPAIMAHRAQKHLETGFDNAHLEGPRLTRNHRASFVF